MPCEDGGVKHVKVNEHTWDTMRLKSTGPYAMMTKRMAKLVLELFEQLASYEDIPDEIGGVYNKYRVIGKGKLGQISTKRILTGIGQVDDHVALVYTF